MDGNFKIESLDRPETQPAPVPAPTPPVAPPAQSSFRTPVQNSIQSTLQAPTSHRALKWLGLVALTLFIISFLTLWLGKPSFSDRDVVLQLDGPTQALSGDEVVYSFTYQNNTKFDLKNINFRFFYPEDSVIFKDGTVSQDTTESFVVDSLPAGQTGKQELHVFLVGDKGNIKNAKLSMVFSAGTLKSSFEKTAAVSTTITGLPVALTLVAPPTTVSGQEITYILDYRNRSEADIADLMIEFTYPDGFTPKTPTPTPSSGKNVWLVPSLKQNAGSRITIPGTLVGTERENKTIQVVVKRKVNDQYIDYEKQSLSTVISSPLLSAEITVNGSKDYTSFVSDRLSYVVKFRNMSNQSLLGVTLQVALEGDMYDLATLQTNGGFYNQTNNSILYNSSSVPEFSSLTPGKSGQVQFNVNLKPIFGSGGGASRNFFVKATATLATPNVPSGIDASEISTQTSLTTKISSQPAFIQLVYWSDPAFGATGPLPPRIGQETYFTVHWQLINPGNDIDGTKVTATLPAGVVWKNIVSAGAGQPSPTYDKNRSQVVWDIGRLPQGIGVGTPKYEGTFQISVTPSLPQKGSHLVLLKDASFVGTDSFTRQSILLRPRDLTTDDPVDSPGNGAVQ